MHSLKFLNLLNNKEGFLKNFDIILDRKHRVALSRLRCGNFGTLSRTGVWSVEGSNRNCRFCDAAELEDELHVIANCRCFVDIRKKFLEKIMLQDGPEDIDIMMVIELMSNQRALPAFAKFVYKIWQIINKFN